MEDKRRFPRHAASLRAAYEIGSGQTVREVETASVNVSRGGCTLRIPAAERPGARLVVHLTLPSGEEVSMMGRIAWVREPLAGQPGSIGVAFEEDADLPDSFLCYVDQLAASPS